MGKIKQQSINSRTEFFYYAFCNILLVGLPLLVVSAFVLSLPHSSATESASTSDQVYITLSTSCTISSELINPHTIDINGGQHKENIGTTKIGTFCNDNNGYSIYAIGYGNNTDGNTDLIGSLGDNYNIHTGIYDGNNPSSSSWGMKLTAGVGTGINPDTGASIATTPPTIVNGYSNYSVVPNIYTLVASRASGTNMNEDLNLDITGSYFTTTYDIYASSIQPSGTYIGKVKYIMTHPSLNASNTITDLEAAFAMAGKEKVYYDENNNGPYFAMQDMTHDICTSVTRNGEITTTQLVDIRDKKSYYVTKLKDGHCWMTENLDLSIGGTGVAALNSNNTDISTNPSVYTSSGIYSDYTVNDGVYTWNPVSTAITSSTKITYSDSSYPPVSPAFPIDDIGRTTPYSAEGGDTYYYTSSNNNNDTRTTLAGCISAGHAENECKHYSAGNYYNWTAAIASNNSTNIDITSEEIATNSVCPKGWKLPNTSQTDNVDNEFGRMLYRAGVTTNLSNSNESVGYTTDGFNKLRSSPYYFVRSSHIYNTVIDKPGTLGEYWSSMTSRSFKFGINGIFPSASSGRHAGMSIRCLAR